MIQSMYSSILPNDNKTYSRDCMSTYYYDTVEMTVGKNGFYRISSDSSANTYGYIYKEKFNSLDPSTNLLAENDDNCTN